MATLQWDNSIDTERSIANAQSGKFLKLVNDGDNARIILLSAPVKQTKQGNSGAFDVYTSDVWNCLQSKQQSFDMAPAQIDGLIALKRKVGQDTIFASELVVVRKGVAGSRTTTYEWTVAGPISDATRRAAAGEPDVQSAPADGPQMPKPRTKEEFLMAEAETVEELRETYGKLRDAMMAADRDDDLEALFSFFSAYRKYLRA